MTKIIALITLLIIVVGSPCEAQSDEYEIPDFDCKLAIENMRHIKGTGPHGYMIEEEPIEIPEEENIKPQSGVWPVLKIIFKCILYAIVFGLVLFILFTLLKRMNGFQGLWSKRLKPKEEIIEKTFNMAINKVNIFGHDYDKEILALIASEDWAQAIVLTYVTTLSILHRRGLVVCADSATPTEYLHMSSKKSLDISQAMRILTHAYLIVVYGPEQPTKELFEASCESRSFIINKVHDMPIVARDEIKPVRKTAQSLIIIAVIMLINGCSGERTEQQLWSLPFHPTYTSPVSDFVFSNIFSEQYDINICGKMPNDSINSRNVNNFNGYEDDMLLRSVSGTANKPGNELTLGYDLLLSRLRNNKHTIIAAERLFIVNKYYLSDKTGHQHDMTDILGGSLIAGNGFDQKEMADDVNKNKALTPITIINNVTGNKFEFPRSMAGCYIDKSRLELLWKKLRLDLGMRVSLQTLFTINDQPVAWRLRVIDNNASIIITSLPLLMTDYGMVYNNGDWAELVFTIFRESRIGENFNSVYHYGDGFEDRNQHIYYKTLASEWTISESSTKSNHNPISIWSLLKKVFKDFAFWFFVLMVLILTLRRRRRVMQIIPYPRNRTTELIHSAARLYEYHGEYRSLLIKRAAVFYTTISDRLHIDVTIDAERRYNVKLIAQATGIKEQEISSLLNALHNVVKSNNNPSQNTTHILVNEMEKIEKKLSSGQKK